MTTQMGEPSAESGLTLTFADLTFEYADLAALGMDAVQPEPPELVNACRAILGTLALRAEEVTLVVTGDFVASVIDRLPDGPQRDAFTMERGARFVAAKTMNTGSRFHVVLPAGPFIDVGWARANLPMDEAEAWAGAVDIRGALVQRTVLHEAQHVVMGQAGEDDGYFADERWGRLHFLMIAHALISEYRAELGINAGLRAPADVEFPVDSMDVLRADLRRIANLEYQVHRDVGRLVNDVIEQTQHAWKALAYLAAARRVYGIGVGEGFPEVATATEAWSLMVSEYWDRFEELLSVIPPAMVRMDTGALKEQTHGLADLLFLWLRSYGFAFLDNADGTVFLIESRHLL